MVSLHVCIGKCLNNFMTSEVLPAVSHFIFLYFIVSFREKFQLKLHVLDSTVFMSSKQLSKRVDSGEGNLINIADLSYSMLKNR